MSHNLALRELERQKARQNAVACVISENASVVSSTSSGRSSDSLGSLITKFNNLDMESHSERDELDSFAGLMAALTVTDEGPDVRRQPSKLWSSSREFHEFTAPLVPTEMRNVPLANAQISLNSIVVESLRSQLESSHSSIVPPSPPKSTQVRPCVHSERGSSSQPNMSPTTTTLRKPSLANHSSPPSAPPSAYVAPHRAPDPRTPHHGRSPLKVPSAYAEQAKKIIDKVERDVLRILESLTFNDREPPTNDEVHILLEAATKSVREASQSLHRVTNKSPEVVERKTQVLEILRRIDDRISLLGVSLPLVTTPVFYSADHVYTNPVEGLDMIAQLAIVLGVVCNVVLGLSGDSCDFIIAIVNMIVRLAMGTRLAKGKDGEPMYDAKQEGILKQLPSSLYTALNRLHVDGRTTLHAACPSCSFTHRPAFDVSDPATAVYPENCVNSLLGPEGRYTCGTPLLECRHNTLRPIKPFLSASLQDHIARALSDPEIEALCDSACDDAFSNIHVTPQETRNVFHAEFMRTFEGPTAGRLFIDRGDRIRLAFAIHVDFFNPNRTTHRGNHDSIGIISLVNLALPENIRYLPENMFLVGIIPGPFEPAMEAINYYVRPVLEEAEIGWRRGFHLSRTASRPHGADVDVAIVLSVNDLPAARKVSGAKGPTSHFYCTVCSAYHRDTMYNTDFDSWKPRDDAEMRRHAEAWRDAETLAEREEIYKTYGVRWSELWRLPYWRPSRMLVIDSMHCILEGVVHYHCRHVLKLNTHEAETSDPIVPAFAYPWVGYTPDVPQECRTKHPGETAHIASLQASLCLPLDDTAFVGDPIEQLRKRLLAKNITPLKFLCYSLHLPSTMLTADGREVPARKKEHFAQLLINWRLTKPWVSGNSHQKTVTSETVKYIQHVINATITPSWINSVPKQYGEKSAGSIKADEWRLLSTIYLPIALVTLWGDDNGSPPIPTSRFTKVLDHTMALFQAVGIACRYSMTTKRATQYRNLMKDWVDGLHGVHPHTKKHPHRPNVHASFHIYDFLLLFGPVTSWWCFPFERLIGAVQKINTNDHVGGELECTILRSHMRGANLRRWLKRPECPEVIRQFKGLFDKAFASSKMKEDMADNDAAIRRLPEVAHYTHNGVTFSRASTHLGNSLISYYPYPAATKPVVGSIQKIYWCDGKVCFSVQQQAALPSTSFDPFCRYPHFPATVYSSCIDGSRDEKVNIDLVLSHVARYDLSNDRTVFVDLSRVCTPISQRHVSCF